MSDLQTSPNRSKCLELKGDPIHLTPHSQGNVMVQDGWAHIYDSHEALRSDLERQAATHPSGPGVEWTDFGELYVRSVEDTERT